MGRACYKDFLKIPYKHLGRSKEGVDCYGLVMLYYKEVLGIELKDWWYEPDWSKKGHNYILDNYEAYKFRRVEEPKKHDVILITSDIKSPIANHIQIYLRDNLAIGGEKTGVRLTDISRSIIKRRIEGFYRCLN